MAEEKFVDFTGLLYYDTKIKAYIDTVTTTLANNCVTKSELEAIQQSLNKVESLSEIVTRHTTQIEELQKEDTENKAVIVDLVKQCSDLAVLLEDTQTRLEFVATKEELEAKFAEVKDPIDNILDDIKELEEFFKLDHEKLEQLLIAMPSKADKEYVDSKIPDVSNLATKEFVLQKIAEAELADQDVDLSAYYTKTETEAAIKSAVDAIDIPDVSNLATKEELEAVQNVAGNNSVKLLAIESDLVDISNALENIPTTYATKEEVAAVEAKVDAIVIPEVPTKVSELENDAGYITAEDIPETDLSNYYNKSETENLIAEAVKDIEHPTVDLEGYATEEWVNNQGFLKEHQDLSEYAKKSDIPQPELFIVDYNAPDFAAALEAYNNGKLLLLTNAAPDANGYAIMNYVREDLITFTKFLMSRSETYGSFNTYYLHNDNTWELAKEVKLNKVDAVVNENSDITGLTIGKNTYAFDNFATTEVVNQINENIQNIENTYVTNETLEQKNYVTEQHITENYITIQDAADTYVTNEEVTEVVTNEVETKVTEVIEQKIEEGEIKLNADAINYDTWD